MLGRFYRCTGVVTLSLLLSTVRVLASDLKFLERYDLVASWGEVGEDACGEVEYGEEERFISRAKEYDILMRLKDQLEQVKKGLFITTSPAQPLISNAFIKKALVPREEEFSEDLSLSALFNRYLEKRPKVADHPDAQKFHDALVFEASVILSLMRYERRANFFTRRCVVEAMDVYKNITHPQELDDLRFYGWRAALQVLRSQRLKNEETFSALIRKQGIISQCQNLLKDIMGTDQTDQMRKLRYLFDQMRTAQLDHRDVLSTYILQEPYLLFDHPTPDSASSL